MAIDPILTWNEVALEANRVSHTSNRGEQTGPPRSARALAIVHLAMHDAYAGVINDPANLPPYLPILPPMSAGASADLAVAAAAHRALSVLFPSQAATFDAQLAALGPSSTAGHAFGIAVADAILLARENDPDSSPASTAGYMPSMERGRHRLDPDSPDESFGDPFYGARSKGFAITARFGLDAPPFGNGFNPAYLQALRQVRVKGIKPDLMATVPLDYGGIPRRPGETVAGIFWGYDGARELGTPPRLYNQIVRQVAMEQENTVAQNARLFALVNVAMADAGILAWDQKYIHNFWRPVLGIREHDLSTGPTAQPGPTVSKTRDPLFRQVDPDADPGWLPLGAPATNSTLPVDDPAMPSRNRILLDTNPNVPNASTMGKDTTPNFPAYPSGHATFGAAALHMTRLFYGPQGLDRGGAEAGQAPEDQGPDALFDGLGFVSDEFNGVNRDSRGTVRPRHTRSFPGGLWQMILENAFSRVLLGVHWAFDAFALNGNAPDFSKNIGGVPLGLAIAEDIFQSGLQPSPVGPRSYSTDSTPSVPPKENEADGAEAEPEAKADGAEAAPEAGASPAMPGASGDTAITVPAGTDVGITATPASTTPNPEDQAAASA